MINKTKQNFDEVIDLLEKNGSSFAIATVIRTMSSTAAKPGMKAIISDKGEILSGWLGGGCVTNAVCNTAKETLGMFSEFWIQIKCFFDSDDKDCKK